MVRTRMQFSSAWFWLIVMVILAAANAVGWSQAEGNPPAPKRVAFVGEAESVEIEVLKSQTGHLLVKPTVNGQEAGWWFLDTGAGINCIDTALAETLKLNVLRDGTANGMGGAQATRYRGIATLALGPVLLEGSEAIELDLTSFEKHLGHKISGIIGYDTFFAAVFEVDHRNGKVTLHDPAKFELRNADWLPIQLLDRRPSVSGSIEGHDAGQLMIDSGSNTGAIVMGRTVETFDLLRDRDVKSIKNGGVGGMHENSAGTLADITLGKTHLKRLDAIFATAGTGGGNEHYQAILGIPALRPFVMFVNYPQMKLALRPHDLPTTRAK